MSNKLYRKLQEGYEQIFSGENGKEYCSFREFLLEDGIEEEGYSLVSQFGGEGEGDHAETIFKLNGDFYKVTYNYYSHDGFDFDYAEAFSVSSGTL